MTKIDTARGWVDREIGKRADLIEQIREDHYEGRTCETPGEFAVDLLADLMHWCEQVQVSFEEAVSSASWHFDAEHSEETW